MKNIRLILCLLAAILIAVMIPAGAHALSGVSGSGTQADPYVIANPNQIWVLTDALNGDPTLADACIRLDCDVDMTGQSWPAAATFEGQLDGNTHTLTLDAPFLDTLAEGSKVKALELVINGAQQAPLFCSVNNGIIEGCGVTGAVDTTGTIGFFCTTNSGSIVNCRGLGSVRVCNDAGFVLRNTDTGSISNCYCAATFSITDSGTYVTARYGPVLGLPATGTISHCYYDGTLFTGAALDSSVKLTTDFMKSAEFADYLNEYNSSTGLAWVPVNNGYPRIDKFYEGTANLTGHPELQVIYHTDTFQITFDKSDASSIVYYTLDGRDPRSSYTRYSDQQSPMTINGDTVVKAVAYKNGQYGTVKTQRVIQLKGSGTAANPYRIYTAVQLDAIRIEPDKWYTIESDITFSTLDFTNTGNFPNGWTPIPEFTGNLNGKGHAIRNIESSAGGLIAANRGTVDSLRIIDHRLYKPGTCGAVANYNYGTVIRCYAKSAFSMSDKPADTNRTMEVSIGGIVGYGNVSYSANGGFVPVTASERYNNLKAGGITGSGTCESCINRGLIAVYPTALTEYVYLGGMSGRGSAHDCLHVGSMYSCASMDYDQYVSMMVGDSNAGLSGSFYRCAGVVSFENNATSGRTYQNNYGSTSTGYRSYILTDIAEKLRCLESSYPDLDFTETWMMSPDGPVPQGVMDEDGHCFSAVAGSYAAPTCTEDGHITYSCSICGTRKTVSLPKADHTPAAAVFENDTAPTCTEAGHKDKVIYCSACHEEISRETLTTDPALGHDWDEPVYAWSEDNGSVTATRTCKRDVTHVDTETANTVSDVTTPATCTAMGETTYTAVFENDAFETQTKTVQDVSALGHDWGEPVFDWTEDYSSVTATRTCKREGAHTETETAAAAGELTTPATCTAMGQTTFTAIFENDAFGTQTKAVENVPALGHDWGEPIYVWASDNSTVTAIRICGNDASHVETEKVTATYDVVVEPTCTAPGVGNYTSAAFSNEAFHVQTKTDELPVLPHTLIHHDAKEPTCTESGWEAYDTCANCDYTTYAELPQKGHAWGEISYVWADDNSKVTATRICANDSSHIETESVSTTYAVTAEPSCAAPGIGTYTGAAFENEVFQAQTKTVELPALEHVLIHHDAKEPTCTESGWEAYDTCANCSYTTYAEIPQKGHAWGEISYVWADDNSKVTATRICANDASHVETEEVAATYAVTVEPSCAAPGIGAFTSAAFKNTAFQIQTKTGELPVLPHTLTHHDAKEPTCTEPGWEAYDSCTNCDYTTYVEIPQKGHVWGEASYVWASDNSKVTAVRICGNDASHAEAEEVAVTYAVTAEPTCTEAGVGTYTCAAFKNAAFQVQTKTVGLEAVGHAYGEPDWTWTEDLSSAEAVFTCAHDETHIETVQAEVSSEVTKKPTAKTQGIRTYTATVTFGETAYTDVRTASIPAKHRRTMEVPSAAPGDTDRAVEINVVPNEDRVLVEVSGNTSADAPILISSYDSNGRFQGLTEVESDATVETEKGASSIRIFWIDEHAAPLTRSEVIPLTE